MPPPPAKRRKRLTVLDSDERSNSSNPHRSKAESTTPFTLETRSKLGSREGPATSISTRTRTKQKTISAQTHPGCPQWSPPSSPERLPAKMKRIAKPRSSGPLHAFFSSTNMVPSIRTGSQRETLLPHVEETEEQEDIIEDDSHDEKSYKLPAPRGISKLSLDRRKPLQEQKQDTAATATQDKPVAASQKFLPVGKAAANEASTQTAIPPRNADTRPWAEKYGPTSLDELMVHKKKVADIRGWLDGVFVGRDRKV